MRTMRDDKGRFVKAHPYAGTGKTLFKKGEVTWSKGKSFLTDERLAINEHHGLWKGDEVGYVALHSWVRRKLGRPKECWQCGFTSDNSRQFHWANLSGEYKRDLTDWKRLCASCHKKMDNARRRLAHV